MFGGTDRGFAFDGRNPKVGRTSIKVDDKLLRGRSNGDRTRPF